MVYGTMCLSTCSACKEKSNNGLKGDRINLAELGIIVCSGWGKNLQMTLKKNASIHK